MSTKLWVGDKMYIVDEEVREEVDRFDGELVRLQAIVDEMPEKIINALLANDKEGTELNPDLSVYFGANHWYSEKAAKMQMLEIACAAAEAATANNTAGKGGE